MTELTKKADITTMNLSILEYGKAKAVCFTTREVICILLANQPVDIRIQK